MWQWNFGYSEGAVELFTQQCFQAIGSLHGHFVHPLTPAEKEVEKQWIDDKVGFWGLWREGWVMYDGMITPLHTKPGYNGDAYYTCKSNYRLNIQVICCDCLRMAWLTIIQIDSVPSNLCTVDYVHGFTGLTHDTTVFEHSAAVKYEVWFFDGEEFAWTDSAYGMSPWSIPVHKEPASWLWSNTIFDAQVSQLWAQSEHCIGELKGWFQCLCGLRVSINSYKDHVHALQWITVAIILHNLIIDVKARLNGIVAIGGVVEEEHQVREYDNALGEAKWKYLVAELICFKYGRELVAQDM